MGVDATWLLADEGVISVLMEQQVTRKMPPLSGHASDTMGSYALSRSMLMLWLTLGITHLSAVRTSPQSLHPLLTSAQIVAGLLLR